ncbi:MAG: hypothetical protein JKY56_03380 [Kofleriaceae bacterium]|nr:hypothetical protein [Kofleriaceae bacterium]
MKYPCPQCSQATRVIKPITLEKLLTKNAKAQIDSLLGFRFCPNSKCEVLYFQPDQKMFLRADASSVPVFQKSALASRAVCYCFGYSVAEVRRATQDPDSSIVQTITEKCRRGEDRCEETNPQGSCCLGNVRAVIRQASSEADAESVSQPSCCALEEDCDVDGTCE